MTVIDVWNPATFDDGLRAFLDENAQLVRDYRAEARRLFEEREAQTVRGIPDENRFGRAISALRANIKMLMGSRTVRAWHYTRLTGPEVAAILAGGMQPMTIEMIARRLDAAVEAGLLDRAEADALFAASPYHEQIDGNRENRIWLTAQPWPLDDPGVEELLDRWGGESVSFVYRDGPTLELLKSFAQPCVIEVAVPVAITTRADSLAVNVLDAYAKLLGVDGGWGGGCDVVAVEPIAPEWILAIHRPGDPSYEAMGRGFPSEFKMDDD